MNIMNGWRIWGLCFALVALCLPRSGEAAEILEARAGLHADKTRLVLDLSEKPDYGFDQNAEVGQVVIELKNIGVPKGRVVPSSVIGLVKHTLFISKGGQSSRVVLFLSKPAKVKSSFVIPPKDGKAHRLVIDLVSSN